MTDAENRAEGLAILAEMRALAREQLINERRDPDAPATAEDMRTLELYVWGHSELFEKVWKRFDAVADALEQK